MRFALLLLAIPLAAQQLDFAINNGRLIDPASNTDAVRSIGIRNGKIVSVSTAPLTAKRTINASGLVIAPGFIDLHSHGQTPENYELKAQDGVTTALEMEIGVWPVAPWYAAREGRALINYGASSGYIPALMNLLHDSGTLLPRDRAVTTAPSDAEWDQVLARVREGISAGALGLGAGIAYTPKVSRSQIWQLFQLAATTQKTVFIHIRYGGPVEPGAIDAVQEVLADAASTGAGLHIVHITSMALRETPFCLQLIKDAHAHGIDVTTEAYPYTAGMTDLSSAVFDEGWQAKQGNITYSDLEWAATGERLTPETFARYRKQGGMVAIHSIPESIAAFAAADPAVIVASDGIMDHGKGHPRAAGTYARVLAKYVREEHRLSLATAISKMSYQPAHRLHLNTKGRIAIGADADVVVFDPAKVQDHATFEHPALPSTGFEAVLVNGTPVVFNGKLQTGTLPGRGVRSAASR